MDNTIRKAIIGKYRKGWAVTLLPVKGFPRYAKASDGSDLFPTLDEAKVAASAHTATVEVA